MHKTIVANSTPIISLHGINRLDILKNMYGKIIIPNAVHAEVIVKSASALEGYDWIYVKSILNLSAKEAFTSALHDGEAETIILAKELDADLIIIDDRLARRHAKYFGLVVTGTVGVLLRAKRSGVINKVRPVLDDLIGFGFYISEDVCQKVLDIADEL